MRIPLSLLAATAVVLAPAAASQTGGRALNSREVANAQRQHSELVAVFGGAETGARGAYVEAIGRRVAAFSGIANPAGVFRYTALNSAVANAFANPGGGLPPNARLVPGQRVKLVVFGVRRGPRLTGR